MDRIGISPKSIFLAMVAMVLFTAVQVVLRAPVGNPFTNHAELAHGVSIASAADKCGENPVVTWANKDQGRYADLCKDENGKYAIFIYRVVDGIKRRVTSFEKDSARSLSDLVDYIKSTGYTAKP